MGWIYKKNDGARLKNATNIWVSSILLCCVGFCESCAVSIWFCIQRKAKTASMVRFLLEVISLCSRLKSRFLWMRWDFNLCLAPSILSCVTNRCKESVFSSDSLFFTFENMWLLVRIWISNELYGWICLKSI